MRHVIPTEITAPNIIEQNRYALHSILTYLFWGNPKIFEKAFLPAMAIMMVAMIQKIMANFE
jgi:hypothetical protein